MRKYLLLLFTAVSGVCVAQSPKSDTVRGVVIYTAPADLIHISKGDYHTYTAEATMIRRDTGIISVQTSRGYLDLRKNYQFIPLEKLQPARLRQKP